MCVNDKFGKFLRNIAKEKMMEHLGSDLSEHCLVFALFKPFINCTVGPEQVIRIIAC